MALIYLGELECITIIKSNDIENLQFCVIDKLALKVIGYYDLSHKAISVQDILTNKGILRKKQQVHYKYSTKRFNKYITEGKLLARNSTVF